MLVSYVIATYNRREELERVLPSVLSQEYEPLEVIIVCNSTDDTPDLFEGDGRFADDDRIRYYHRDERMGVTGARNFGYRKADGDILVTIDDDAVIPDPDATARMVELFERDEDTGIAAFRVENHYSGEFEFPYGQSELESRLPFVRPLVDLDLREAEVPTETTAYKGCGNAIRASLFEEVGYYPDDFFYGVEEIELSFRALDAGYRVMYLPSVRVVHREAPEGRLPDTDMLQGILENRLRTAIWHHPLHYLLFETILWSGRTVYRTGSLRPVLSAWQTIVGQFGSLWRDRDVLDRETVEYIHDCGGRLY
ncbi:glycosyltransferase family 2 protein [Haloarcula sp. GH36]|uniref:glycosyltransferase family 2 protein n=1 Tax=Haloarcula montana TaxID=3111776 RepID=UPI002D7849CE|nr:glycosyltransferase family 2 protein [Haloarcula sp. GH36]